MTAILSKNLFDLLDPDEAQVAEQPARPADKKDAAKKPANAGAAGKSATATRAPRNEYRPRGGATQGGESRPVTRSGPRETGDFEAPPRSEGERGQRVSRGVAVRGGRGGGGGGGGGFRNPNREFDRRSQNPRHDGEKKEVAGKGSWGEEIAAQTEEKIEGDAVDGEVTEKDAAAAPVKEAEPEEVQYTLEQHLANQAAKKAAIEEKAVRKPNEGADDAQWKDAVVLKKEEEDEDLFGLTSKGNKGKKAAVTPKEKAVKSTVPMELRFATEAGSNRGSDRGGRGGRGRGEYRGGRGGDRGGDRRGGSGSGRGSQSSARGGSSVNVGDQTAFPTLGSK